MSSTVAFILFYTLVTGLAFVATLCYFIHKYQGGAHLVWTQTDDGTYSHNPAQISSKDGFSNPQNGDPGF